MKIVVGIPFTQAQKQRLSHSAAGASISYVSWDTANVEEIRKANIIMGNIPLAMLREAKALQWLQLDSSGASQYCTKGVLPDAVALTNASGAYGEAVSEVMLAFTMALFKKLYRYLDNQRASLWKDEGQVCSPVNAVILVLGTGDIGRAYARKMRALGSYVIGIRRHGREHADGFDEIGAITELDAFLGRADLVAVALPGTKETAGLLDEKRLRQMKRGAYLLNVGRGNIIAPSDLQKIMEEGYLSGAALDVTDPEPLPEDHPLWHTPGVWITPHVAGGFHLDLTLDNIAGICCENLDRFLARRDLLHQVDRNQEY